MHYTYDSLNRLTGIDRAANDAQQEQGQEIAHYRYNLFGQRIAKTVALANGKGTKTTHYFYDGSHLVFEASDQDTPTKQFVWINDKPVAMLQGSSILAIHTDHRNAPIAVTDEARQVVWQAKVSDYLNSAAVQEKAQNKALGTITLNLRGSNQYFDAESGLHYNTQRYFDPLSARYLTPDPLGLAVGPDLYAFALNRPQSVSDPLGLEPTLVLDGPSGVRANTNTSFMVVFAGIQFIPGADVVIDLIVAGAAVYMLGSGAIDLIKTLVTLDANISSAKCGGDLDLAAKALAAGLVKSTGEVVGGAAAGYSSISGGGVRRIADGIRKVTEFAKGRFGVKGVTSVDSTVLNTIPKAIGTPYGDAVQSSNAAALAARTQVNQGATLYRIGTLGKSQAGEAQFWSLENPANPGYAGRYGIPPENVANADFIEMAYVPTGTPYITRPAPAVGPNPGGGIEVVVPPNSIRLRYFGTH